MKLVKKLRYIKTESNLSKRSLLGQSVHYLICNKVLWMAILLNDPYVWIYPDACVRCDGRRAGTHTARSTPDYRALPGGNQIVLWRRYAAYLDIRSDSKSRRPDSLRWAGRLASITPLVDWRRVKENGKLSSAAWPFGSPPPGAFIYMFAGKCRLVSRLCEVVLKYKVWPVLS